MKQKTHKFRNFLYLIFEAWQVAAAVVSVCFYSISKKREFALFIIVLKKPDSPFIIMSIRGLSGKISARVRVFVAKTAKFA